MTESATIDSIQQAALRLEPEDRAQLAHALVQSLNALSQSEIEKLWLDEAERRDAEMQSGRVVGLPGDEVFRRIRARYGK